MNSLEAMDRLDGELKAETPMLEQYLEGLKHELAVRQAAGLDTSETVELIEGFTSALAGYRDVAPKADRIRHAIVNSVHRWFVNVAPEGRA